MPPGFLRELAEVCGSTDAALARAARQLATLLAVQHTVEPARVTQMVRRAGSPYVWPRAWSFLGAPHEREETQRRMQAWLSSFAEGGERRCGLASSTLNADRELVVVIAVDALAELHPLPVRAREMSWVDVNAELLVPSAGSQVVVLGPRGAPRRIPTSDHDSRVLARFNVDRAGPWLVQLLSTVEGGPRPVLEALVFSGVEPSEPFETPSAPGEDAVTPSLDPRVTLEQLIEAARREERLPPLARSDALDTLAQSHAERMRSQKRVAHDVGGGDPLLRLENAGLPGPITATGENVAHAATALAAHRSLWSSPSHRANLLSAEFDSLGLGVSHGEDGSVWVCQLFARRADL
jgi:uncharacterized protein YkwD